MANPKGNPQNLKSYKPKWKSGKTKTIRIPTAIAPLVLEAAREIDKNDNVSLLQVIEDNFMKLLKMRSQFLVIEVVKLKWLLLPWASF